jgi:hypothetical protein
MAARRLTDNEVRAQIPSARVRARRSRRTEPIAAAARYQPDSRRLVVELRNGAFLGVPLELLPDLHDATAEELARLTIGPAGLSVQWPALDQDLSIEGLARIAFGSATLRRAWGSEGGSARTAAKARAARRNGLKGGRPRKRRG